MANLDEKQIEGLQRLLSLLDPKTLTKEEFVKNFKIVVDLIKEMKQKNAKLIAEFGEMHKQLKEDLKSNNSNDFSGIKADFTKELSNLNDKYNKAVATLNAKLTEIKDGQDGRDADEDGMIERLKLELPQMEDLKKDIPVMGTEIRNALELLQGEERLDKSAIKGLEETLKDLEEKISSKSLGGGGGMSSIAMNRRFIDDEDLAGTKNGVNTTFTISKIPATGSLKVFRNGQRLRVTEDYTLVGKTIEMIIAPESDELLYADFRF